MIELFIFVFVMFFVIIDLLGCVLIFVSFINGMLFVYCCVMVICLMLVVVIILFVFVLVGKVFLSVLYVSFDVFCIVGGIMLFLIVFDMVFEKCIECCEICV